MQLLHLRGDVHTQPATRNNKQMFFHPTHPLNVRCGTSFKLTNYQPSELSTQQIKIKSSISNKEV